MRHVRWAAVFLALGLAMSPDAADAAPTYEILKFEDLDGWQDDDHSAALSVFLNTCADIKDPEWATLCALATSQPSARTFFELFFRPVLINGDEPALFTGYFEPELRGSRTRGGPYQYPLHSKPPEVRNGTTWSSRREIEELGLLEGRGLELVWIDDPVEKFFLQVQGSGRVKLAEGGAMRVGYGGKNGHKYKSIGRELIRRGIYEPHQVSAQVIRNWVKRNPVDGAELLRHNPSYVFFREVSEVPADKGPLGAMNRSITPMRSIAVDPKYNLLGGPIWIEKAGAKPLKRLMIAQDTGSAIKGAQRADIYYGTGDKAGRAAGRIRDKGRLVSLMPIQTAYTLVPGG